MSDLSDSQSTFQREEMECPARFSNNDSFEKKAKKSDKYRPSSSKKSKHKKGEKEEATSKSPGLQPLTCITPLKYEGKKHKKRDECDHCMTSSSDSDEQEKIKTKFGTLSMESKVFKRRATNEKTEFTISHAAKEAKLSVEEQAKLRNADKSILSCHVKKTKDLLSELLGKLHIIKTRSWFLSLMQEVYQKQIDFYKHAICPGTSPEKIRCLYDELLKYIDERLQDLCKCKYDSFTRYKTLDRNFAAIKLQHENIKEAKRIFITEVTTSFDKYNKKKCILLSLNQDSFFRLQWSKQNGPVGMALKELSNYLRNKMFLHQNCDGTQDIDDNEVTRAIQELKSDKSIYKFKTFDKFLKDFDNTQLHWFLTVGTFVLRLDPCDFKKWSNMLKEVQGEPNHCG